MIGFDRLCRMAQPEVESEWPTGNAYYEFKPRDEDWRTVNKA
jgi:hypothetical protein